MGSRPVAQWQSRRLISAGSQVRSLPGRHITLEFPIRINKYLAHKGVATRRAADSLIKSGNVFINGKRAELGDKVQEKDDVQLKGVQGGSHAYVAYYKPLGVVTHSPQYGEPEIKNLIKNKNLFPVGRLDKDSEGLIILTDDGRVTERLLSPRFEHEKEYEVSVREKVSARALKLLERGVVIEDFKTKPCKTERTGEHSFRITLTEGQKHQVRRMCDALKYTVEKLKRVRVMNITLGKLSPGEERIMKSEELKTFLAELGLASERSGL